MKKYFVLIFLIITPLMGQFDFTASMGIHFQHSPLLKKYINMYYASSQEQLSTFNASALFKGECDYSISNNFQVGIEYGYHIYSFMSQSSEIGTYDISCYQHKPSLIAYYVIAGEGYKFKFGGGGGIRIISVDERLPISTLYTNYTSSGIGFVGKGQAHTLLSDSFYLFLEFEVRYDLPGEPGDGDRKIENVIEKEIVNFNSLSFGINIGVSFFL